MHRLLLCGFCLFCFFVLDAKPQEIHELEEKSIEEFDRIWRDELKTKIANKQFPAWMMEQIHRDLSPFRDSGFTSQEVLKTIERYPTYGFVVCTIENNNFSWACYGPDIKDDYRPRMLVDGLRDLAKTIPLPNVQFLVYVSEAFAESANKAPVFSWCKHDTWSACTICIPDYEALTGNRKYLDHVLLGDMLFPWKNKKNCAIWRGVTSGGWGFSFNPRLKLVQVSSANPSLLDAKFTHIFPGPEASSYQPFKGQSMPIADHLEYKYQILADGHVSAFSRAYWQLFSGCVTFKQDSPWYQWFYGALEPYKHYIPYKEDASDLIPQIMWAIEHDDEVHQMAMNAHEFADKNLRYSDVMLYVYLLLNEYAQLQKD